MAKKSKNTHDDPVQRELRDIKRLLVLQLISSGVQAAHIATALQVDAATVSRMVPTRRIKKS